MSKQPSTSNPTPPVTDRRPHVAAILELATLGLHVTEIRPDGSGPQLWRVTIARYDLSAWIAATDADPDDALNELTRYAATDAKCGAVVLDELSANAEEP